MSVETSRGMLLGELARIGGATLRGDGSRRVFGLETLEHAGPGSISFFANPRYRHFLQTTQAAAVILSAENADDCPVDCLISDNPDLVRARVMARLYPAAAPVPGIDPTATLGDNVTVDPSAQIAAGCVLGDRVHIGAGVIIGPKCVLLDDVVVGEGSHLVATVTLGFGTRIGRRCLVHPGAVIGADGFGFANDQGSWVKVPQVGHAVLGDDVEIGSCASVNRGAIGDTVIGDGVKVDSQVHIAHNVRIGRQTAIAGCTAIAGSSQVGERCILGGAVGVVGHVHLADDVHVSAATLVTRSISEPGVYTGAIPAMPHAAWAKNFARLRRLDDMVRRVQTLEQELAALKANIQNA